MPPGVPDFQLSGVLTHIASAHSLFLTGQDKDWLKSDKNMHRGPDGTLTTEAGQPMEQAGYHTWRSENVALGFDTAEKAVRSWMQLVYTRRHSRSRIWLCERGPMDPLLDARHGQENWAVLTVSESRCGLLAVRGAALLRPP